jgi:tetratricopeptide (TPR) repeat protein
MLGPSRYARSRDSVLGIPLPLLLCLAALTTLSSRPAWASDDKDRWQEYRSAHFVVITDAGEKKGKEITLRFEQMRAVFSELLSRKRVSISEPLTIFALKSDKQYYQMAPIHNGQAISAPGFFVPGDDRSFIVLNAFEVEPWRAVNHDFAHFLLKYNYPPTQAWFDEGFVEYYSALRLDNKSYEIGSDPELNTSYTQDLIGTETQVHNRPRTLTELLNAPVWLAVPDLFTMKHDLSNALEGTHRTLFYAQSWITVSYLLNKNKLSDTGTYFDLVQNQKLPVEKAILQAYDMSVEQFDKAVKDYYHSLGQLQDDFNYAQQPRQGNLPQDRMELYKFPVAVGLDDVEVTIKPETEADIRAQLAEVMVRLPERRQQGLNELQAVLNLKDKDGQVIDNEIAHRALAWVAIDTKQFEKAAEELGLGAIVNPRDAWLRYYLALMKYRQAQASQQEIQGLANMMQDLKSTLDWYPEFAEAYNMLAMARLEGGGAGSAMDAIRAAIKLSPRNQQYVFNLALVYVASKQWDAAQATFERLEQSPNPQMAAAAKAQMKDFAITKKYGINPSAPKRAYQASPFDELAQEAQKREQVQQQTAPDTRPTQYLKGKLLRVDCSQPPVATMTVSNGAKTLKFHAADVKSLVVIGADEFSCDWHNRDVTVNYKPGGGSDGDVVSVELRGN